MLLNPNACPSVLLHDGTKKTAPGGAGQLSQVGLSILRRARVGERMSGLEEENAPQSADGTRNPRTDLRSPRQILDGRQWRFIRVTGEVVPELWAELRQTVAPLHGLAMQAVPADSARAARWNGLLNGSANLAHNLKPGAPPPLVALAESVAVWQARWHLNAPWCERYALATLSYWHRYPDFSGPVPNSIGAPYCDPRPLRNWKHSRTEQRDIKAARMRAGWRQFPTFNTQAMKWLALYQCKAFTGSELSDLGEEGNGIDAILKAVMRAGRSIDLPLRQRRN